MKLDETNDASNKIRIFDFSYKFKVIQVRNYTFPYNTQYVSLNFETLTGKIWNLKLIFNA